MWWIELLFFILGLQQLEKWKFQKMKKTPGGYLHRCTKNHDHMLYCSWDMACGRCNCYFSFWAIFCPSHLNTPKNEKFKKWKKRLEISSFNTSIPKIMIICSTFLWYMARNRCNFYFSFWAIFCPNSPKTKNFNKWKNHPEISSFYTCVPKQYIPTYVKYMLYEITGTGTSPEKLESLL